MSADLPPELEPLLNDPAFRRWVYAPEPGDEATWARQRQDPVQRVRIDAARQLLLRIRGPVPALSTDELDARVRDLMRRAAQEPTARVIRFGPKQLSYAAAVLFLLGTVLTVWRVMQPSATKTAPTYQRIAVENTGERPRLVSLGDGSSVLLQRGSRLVYEQPFRPQVRRVWLSGEAFFEVRKSARHPFRIRAGNRFTTEVLGTSFRISAFAGDSAAVVAVKSGRVAVYRSASGAPLPEAVLTARQQAVFREEALPVYTTAIPPEPVFLIERQPFAFQGTPLREVVRVLEQAYGISVELRSGLLSCTLTASLGDEPLAEKLRIISAALDATYHLDGTRVRLEGEGCAPASSPAR
jgi:transmembrane sensor